MPLFSLLQYNAKAKLFCQKSLILVTVGVFMWENFHPGHQGNQ